jgi:hypothetical protein
VIRVGDELAVVDAHTPVRDGAKPAVLRVARAIRVAPAIQITVDLQTRASVGVDVLVAAAHAVGASVRVIGDTVGFGVTGGAVVGGTVAALAEAKVPQRNSAAMVNAQRFDVKQGATLGRRWLDGMARSNHSVD